MCRVLVWSAVGFWMASSAATDVVTLRSGTTLEGVVRREPGRVRIVMDSGILEIADDLVAGIESRRAPLEVYRERAAAIPDGDVASRLRLAAWCRDQGLYASAREQAEQVLAIDPDQAEARRALGYQLHGGVWMTEAEIRRARGEIWSEGTWWTPAELAARDSERRALAAERLRAERDAALAAQDREAACERERARVDDCDSCRYESARVVLTGARPRYRVPPSCRFQGGLYPWWCIAPGPASCPRPVSPDRETTAWHQPPGPAWNPMPPWGQPR